MKENQEQLQGLQSLEKAPSSYEAVDTVLKPLVSSAVSSQEAESFRPRNFPEEHRVARREEARRVFETQPLPSEPADVNTEVKG